MLVSFTGGSLPRRATLLRRAPIHDGGRSLSLLLSEIFKNEKMPSKSAAFPRPPPGRRKKRRHPSAFAKKPQSHANKNTAIPLHGALKKSLHEHSRFSLCPPNSAIRALQLKDSLPPPLPAPAIIRPHGGPAFPMPALPCVPFAPLTRVFFSESFYISFFYPLLSGNKYASTL